ncbi:nuclear pore complex protein Nup50 [Phlebotomus argentipes]|uniref:nuclear pore complex protein Nup50 n=1 Tax=Phlebotomus argentipes TaxID=94469 RepID=UPI002892FF64|nr:nuclear pore complex protein Nup50 [Phlebotomus argentipes]
MNAKRKNLGELNSDNWDDEDAPEDRGVFRKAPEDELKSRVIRTARRRVAPATESKDAPPPGIFSGFAGFSKTASVPVVANSPFSLLSKTTSSPAVANDPPKTSEDKKSSEDSTSEYHKKLIDLNKSLLEWIKSKIEKNPVVILSPIFDDYEKHLKEIKSSEKTTIPAASGAALKGFSFSAATPSTSALSGFSSTTPATTSVFGGNSLTASASTGFSFGATKPFTFGNVTKPTDAPESESKADDEDGEEESDEPPKVSFTPVVEEDSVFSKRCKVYIKGDSGYKERGIGTLFLKSVNEGKKIQMIVRADTSLGNVLVNLMLNKRIPVNILGKNNVMLVCVPNADFDKPVSMLLKVKNADEAEEVKAAIEKYATD